MKEYLKCRACGYIMDKEGAPDICPACGVGKKAFEEYKYNISEKRRIILSIDIHPIILHIPQGVSAIIPFFALLSMLLPLHYAVRLTAAVEMLVYLLPLSVFGAFISGVFDGKVRFKKISTPALKKKMILGAALFAVTAAMLYIQIAGGVEAMLLPITFLSVFALGLQAILARIGIKLMFAYMPG